ncbi:hypothetical protein BGZ83_007861 [Gryganskiella cystojenkinii]|nr:hypothetical protein BGZ83_007861 [Gryganskiella cystojenkinii]
MVAHPSNSQERREIATEEMHASVPRKQSSQQQQEEQEEEQQPEQQPLQQQVVDNPNTINEDNVVKSVNVLSTEEESQQPGTGVQEQQQREQEQQQPLLPSLIPPPQQQQAQPQSSPITSIPTKRPLDDDIDNMHYEELVALYYESTRGGSSAGGSSSNSPPQDLHTNHPRAKKRQQALAVVDESSTSSSPSVPSSPPKEANPASSAPSPTRPPSSSSSGSNPSVPVVQHQITNHPLTVPTTKIVIELPPWQGFTNSPVLTTPAVDINSSSYLAAKRSSSTQIQSPREDTARTARITSRQRVEVVLPPRNTVRSTTATRGISSFNFNNQQADNNDDYDNFAVAHKSQDHILIDTTDDDEVYGEPLEKLTYHDHARVKEKESVDLFNSSNNSSLSSPDDSSLDSDFDSDSDAESSSNSDLDSESKAETHAFAVQGSSPVRPGDALSIMERINAMGPPNRRDEVIEAKVAEMMQWDEYLRRFRYSHPSPVQRFTNEQHIILEAAYLARHDQILKLKDEDFEFFATAARCHVKDARTWFQERVIRRQEDDRKWLQEAKIPSAAAFRQRQDTQRRPPLPSSPPPSSPPPSPPIAMRTVTRKSPKSKRQPKPVQPKPILNDDGAFRFKGPAKGYWSADNGDFYPVVRVSIEKGHQVLQDKRCIAYKKVKGVEFCRPCVSRQADDICAFTNFRFFSVENQRRREQISELSFGPDFFSDPANDTPLEFEISGLSQDDVDHALVFLAPEFQRLMGRQTSMAEEAVDFIHRPETDRRICELCKGAIVNHHFMCSACAQDLCPECYDSEFGRLNCTYRRIHIKEQFEPVGRFQPATLREFNEAFRRVAKSLPKKVLRAAVEHSKGSRVETSTKQKQRMPWYTTSQEIDIAEFQERWAASEVVVVAGVGASLKKNWSLKGMLALTKNEDIEFSVTNCATQEKDVMRMHDFLQSAFGHEGTLRLVEWPTGPFATRCPDFHEDLLKALPLKDYTSPTGKFNLARYFPVGQKNVELGFKMYPGQGLGEGDVSFGTFNLNCGLADEIYVCTYTATAQSTNVSSIEPRDIDESTAVIWDIFRPEDRSAVAEFITLNVMKESRNPGSQDPFTNSRHYLGTSRLSQLEKKFKVRPYRVYQRAGEAVMIPAGSARQARYVADTILTGLDFVSPETMSSTLEWSTEKRDYLLLQAKGRVMWMDVIQASCLLFYSTLAFTALGLYKGGSTPEWTVSTKNFKKVNN